MSNLLYLLAALTISVVGGLVLYYRTRRPRSLQSGIEEFHRELKALAPKEDRRAAEGGDDGRGRQAG